jgi:DNA-binding SARP family transcriptional activator
MRETGSAADVRVSLLGGFSVTIDGRPVEGHWRLGKARTLVKLLALTPRHRLHRDVVVELLWPGTEPQAAANNLHQVVHSIRRMLGQESVTLTDNLVRLCPTGGLRVDVEVFDQAAATARSSGDVAVLHDALQLWTGPLLPEDEYADWAIEHRERLTETHAAVATLLASKLSEQGQPEAALTLLEPLKSPRPLDEHLHRVLIESLAAVGRRWEAIETYEQLRDALDKAYAAEPQPPTRALYRRLLVGGRPIVGGQAPSPLERPGHGMESLVGRDPEWEQLSSSWQRASVGESHLLLISGEAGIGKTRLAEELLAWADWQGIASARTRSYGAEGRLALAPVSEWLRSDAVRHSFGRIADVWLTEIARLVPELLDKRPQLPRPEPMTEFGQRQRFFEALSTAVLAAPQPLLLVIDDLQWCDRETLEWLHFLLRFDPKKRLLVVGTVRLEELVPAHPVLDWLVDLRSEGSVMELSLDSLDAAETAQLAVQVTKRELDDESASRLYRETEGNPLFVVEMASAGPSKGVDKRGSRARASWAPPLSAANLPPRMHAVIARRLAQLTSPARELAGLAATVGRVFTLDILRKASGADADVLNHGLDELWQRRIVRIVPQQSGLIPVNTSTGEEFSTNANGFDFSHDKIRDVAYAELSPVRRRYCHLRIAEALEEIHAASLDPVSAQLAAQYEQAGEPARALPFYERAAEVAQRLYAYDEAMALLRRGLALIDNLLDKENWAEQQLNLLRLLSLALVATHGYGAPEVVDILSRAQTLNQRLGKPSDPLLLRAQAIAALNVSNFRQSLAFGDQLLQLADQQRDSVLLIEGHYVLGVTLSWAGSFTRSRVHLEQALAQYDTKQSTAHIMQYSQDPKVICQCRLAFDLWCLGYPKQAQAVQHQGLAQAQELGHPFTLCYALIWDAMLQGVIGNDDALLQSAEAAIALGDRHHLRLWSSWGTVLRGWALGRAGEPELSIAELQRGDEQMRAIGASFLRPFVSTLVVEQLAKIGQVEHGLRLVSEALASTANERYWCDAELERLRGELLSTSLVDAYQAEEAYRRAILIAQKQRAKLFELRATTGLARLWLKQGRSDDSHEMLSRVYGWFAEGLDTPDLESARATLDA